MATETIITTLWETPNREESHYFQVGDISWFRGVPEGKVQWIKWISYSQADNDGVYEVKCEHSSYMFPPNAVAIRTETICQ